MDPASRAMPHRCATRLTVPEGAAGPPARPGARAIAPAAFAQPPEGAGSKRASSRSTPSRRPNPRQNCAAARRIAVDRGPRFARDRRSRRKPCALSIAFEDAAILVLDKPAGLVVHPGSGNWDGTLLNALLHHAPALAALPRAGIVHRLDKDTSGLAGRRENARSADRSRPAAAGAHGFARVSCGGARRPRARDDRRRADRTPPDAAHVDGGCR